MEKIEEKLGKKHLLVITEPEKHQETVLEELKLLQKKEIPGVYLSFQNPLENLKKRLRKEKVQIEKIKFIDLATEEEKEGKTIKLEPEAKLTKITRSVLKQLKKIKHDKKFVLIDSIDTPTLYRSIENTMKITEFIYQLGQLEKNLVIILNTSKKIENNQLVKDLAERLEVVKR